MTELDAYKATDLKSKSGASGKAKGDDDTSLAEGDHMTFKLFYQPQQAHFNTTTRVSTTDFLLYLWLRDYYSFLFIFDYLLDEWSSNIGLVMLLTIIV